MAAKRELAEEIFIQTEDLNQLGQLDFYFPFAENPEKSNQRVVVFTCYAWHGEIAESKEIRPQWFSMDNFPWTQMWEDYQFWLPKLLKGEGFAGEFLYDKDLKVVEFGINTLKNYPSLRRYIFKVKLKKENPPSLAATPLLSGRSKDELNITNQYMQ